MRKIQKFLFIIAMVAGLSVGAFAQKDDKKPPKPTPPVVNPQPKPPPKDDKPKKPGNEIAYLRTFGESI
jgi:hypothetical protein